MQKDEFARRFRNSIEEARTQAAGVLGESLPVENIVHLIGHSGKPTANVSVEEAINDLYLGDDKTYRVIDVAVLKVNGGRTLILVRPTSHEPSQVMWDTPVGSGPFKVMVPGSPARHSSTLRKSFVVLLVLLSVLGYTVMYLMPGPMSHLGAIFELVITLLIVLWIKKRFFERASLLKNCLLLTVWSTIYFGSVFAFGCTQAERESVRGSDFKIAVIALFTVALGVVLGFGVTKDQDEDSPSTTNQ
jgi:hypothetical protein